MVIAAAVKASPVRASAQTTGAYGFQIRIPQELNLQRNAGSSMTGAVTAKATGQDRVTRQLYPSSP